MVATLNPPLPLETAIDGLCPASCQAATCESDDDAGDGYGHRRLATGTAPRGSAATEDGASAMIVAELAELADLAQGISGLHPEAVDLVRAELAQLRNLLARRRRDEPGEIQQ